MEGRGDVAVYDSMPVSCQLSQMPWDSIALNMFHFSYIVLSATSFSTASEKYKFPLTLFSFLLLPFPTYCSFPRWIPLVFWQNLLKERK